MRAEHSVPVLVLRISAQVCRQFGDGASLKVQMERVLIERSVTRMTRLSICFVMAAMWLSGVVAQAANYYMDAAGGSDAADGRLARKPKANTSKCLILFEGLFE